MRRFLKFIWIPILLFGLLVLLLVLNNNNNKNSCNTFEFDDVLFQVNLATNDSFFKVDYSEVYKFMPVDFKPSDKFILATDIKKEEYFILGQNLTEKQMFDLKSFIDTNNNLYPEKSITLVEYDEYIYAIFSEKYDSFIEGIIRSYMYC